MPPISSLNPGLYCCATHDGTHGGGLVHMEGARVAAKNSPLAERLAEVKEKIAAAARKAGREPSEVTLIAVTKTAAPEQVREILQLGVGDLGESRVQVFTQ